MAEIQFSVLSRCCLRQRLPGEDALRREVRALVTERNAAQTIINRTGSSVPADTHARVLLLGEENQAGGAMRDEEIARALKVGGRRHGGAVRRRCVEEGLEGALGRKEQLNRRPSKLEGQGGAHLVAPWLAPNRRRAGPVGRCNCWPTSWWSGR